MTSPERVQTSDNKRHETGAESPESPKTARKASVPKDAENSQGRSISPRSDGRSEDARAEIGAQRARRLSDCPPKYRNLYRRAWTAKSRKAAIRAFCLECVGWSEKEVRLCTAPACPLYEFRLRG